MRYIFALLLILITSQAFGAASLTPAFSTFSTAGSSINAGKAGTNTLQVVGATVGKISGKPTMVIEGPSIDARNPLYHLASDGADYGAMIKRVAAAFPAGAKIVFPSGTFDIAGNTSMTGVNNLAIEGQGPSTVLRPKWDGTLPYASVHMIQFISSAGISIKNLAFDGRVSEGLTNSHPQSLWFINCDNVVIENNKFYNMNVQDRAAMGLYGVSNYKVVNNTILDADVGVMAYNSSAGQNLIEGNTINGGYSEGISIYSDASDINGGVQTTASRSTIITGNFISDKDSTCFNIYNVANAGVQFINNICEAKHRNDFSGVTINISTGVDIINNEFIGPIPGVLLYGQSDNNRIIGNRFRYSIAGVSNGNQAYVLTGTEILDNTYIGPLNIPACSDTKVYMAGEMCSSDGVYYQGIVDGNVGHLVSDTAYWITPYSNYTSFYPIAGNFTNTRIERNSIRDSGRPAIVTGTGTTGNRIEANKVLNCSQALYITPGSSATLDSWSISNNYFEGTSASSNAVSLAGYKITNSIFANNIVTATSTPEPLNSSIPIVESSRMSGNLFKGGGSYSFAEFKGVWSKTSNTFDKVPSASRYGVLPVNGYIRTGQRYDVVSPVSGGPSGYICTTAGYAYLEAYNAGHSYTLGQHVLGSDNKVYVNILADSGSSDHAPVTGGTWSTYWQLAGGVGTPVAVMKGYGAIDMLSTLSGILKADGAGNLSAAVAGTDYLSPSSDTFNGDLNIGGAEFKIAPFYSSNTSLANIDLFPLDGSSNSTIRFFRNVNTSGIPSLEVFLGDGSGTVNNHIAGKGNTYFVASTGNVCIGASGCSKKLSVTGDASVSTMFSVGTYTFAALSTVATAGTMKYCTDCTTAATCAGGGTGHMAVSNGTNWTCQ